MPNNSAIDLSRPLKVGDLDIRNRVFLAPMSGVTDVPFRRLAWRYGAGLVVSEMVASEAFVEGEAEMQLKVQSAGLPLHVVQLAGREAKWMARAAIVAEANGAHSIDINMGCPAKRVTTGYSGSALMRDLDHALTLVEATIAAVDIPVTLKMRLGWDDQSINAPELARRAENAGVRMITVHGRTRCQFYKGEADWGLVAKVRSEIGVPLVVNGDIWNRETSEEALQISGADAVMLGRSCYGQPWLAGLIAGNISDETANQLRTDVSVALEHHEAILSFYGREQGIRQARKHLGWYLDQLNLPKTEEIGALKRKVMTSFDVSSIHTGLSSLYALEQGNASLQAA